jgi:hypothetical protein
LLVRDWRVVDAAEVNLTVMIGPITRVYRALCTTAPTEYDRGTSITLLTGPAGSIEGLLSGGLLSNDKQVAARVVLIEDSHFEWHRARYSSGLYANAEPDPDLFGPSEIAAELLRRLDRGTPTQL